MNFKLIDMKQWERAECYKHFSTMLYVGSAVSKRNRRNNFASIGKETRGYTTRNGLQWNIEI